ncbi:MAG: hypothetical protein ABIG66_00815 [Candidatus Kerfeldbacteria bacterium]
MAAKKKQFKEPEPSSTPEQRTKFLVLGILAGALVIVLWAVTLPYNLHAENKTAPGPQALFGFLGETIAKGTLVVDVVKTTTEAAKNAN